MSNRPNRRYHVHIMTNRSYTSLYTGVTNDLARRVWQHKHQPSGFVKRYRTTLLVYMHQARKIGLVDSQNPSWRDLSEGT